MSIQLGLEADDLGLATWRAVVAEFIATAVFVLVGTGAVISASNALDGGGTASFIVAVALAFGIAIAVLVAATARISGGHINPAVTFAAVMAGRMKVSTGVLYVAAQLAGAVVGSLILKTIIAGPIEGHLGANALNVYNGSAGLLSSEVGDGAGAALLLEASFTFLLVFVVFATAVDPKGPRHLAPIAIGLAVLAAHLVCIPMTGTSINPARSFGPAVAGNFWTDHWVFWLGPLIGAGIAALVYESVFIDREEPEPPSEVVPTPLEPAVVESAAPTEPTSD
jgi:aquaporin TIP